MKAQAARVWLSASRIAVATGAVGLPLRGQQMATPEKLPRWRGFNLVDKFHLSRGRHPFREKDFRLIAELGFNVVRLPMDYRFWIKDGDWEQFDEATLKEIDAAVALGEKYGVHVMINFHRAPGYCINKRPPEPSSLWNDAETQRVCALHWRTFAARYKGIANDRLCFNLFNEPSGVDATTYLRVVAIMVDAIRAEDPDRLIVSDSFFGDSSALGEGLKRLRVAFSPHQYWPGRISHYKASWVKGSDTWPEPTWPLVSAAGTLYSPTKQDVPHGPLTMRGPFAQETALRVRVHKVSGQATLVAKADGAEVWRQRFEPGPGEGEWREVVFAKQWNLYQNIYDRDYTCTVPAGTQAVTLENEQGDWLRLSQVGIAPAGATQEHVLELAGAWAEKPAEMRYAPSDLGGPFLGGSRTDIDSLREHVASWQQVEAHGVGVFIGEFGVFNKTAHDVALQWMEDSLKVMQEAGWGWALWNFRGGFGILDSNRADVTYEPFEGHQLDRKMLELLQRY